MLQKMRALLSNQQKPYFDNYFSIRTVDDVVEGSLLTSRFNLD